MNEKIYTIPVNEAFDKKCSCPICELYEYLENREVDAVLGASMMEPDVRIETNKKGFCQKHYKKMFEYKNRLSLALVLQSHLDEVYSKAFSASVLNDPQKQVQKITDSCYICDRIEDYMQKFYQTVFYLFKTDKDFVKKLSEQKMFCLEHYSLLLSLAKKSLPKKDYISFVKIIEQVEKAYFDKMKQDIDWFCKKFDYRFKDADWKDSKDAVERAIKLLS